MASEREVNDLRRQIEQLESELDISQKANTQLTQENSRLSGVLSNFSKSQERVQELEQLNTNLNNQISNLQTTASEITRLRETLSSFEASSDEYRNLADQLKREKDSLEEQLSSRGAELSDALMKVSTLSASLDLLNTEKLKWETGESKEPDLDEEVPQTLKKELENSQKALKLLNDEYQKAQEESFELYSALAETQEAYETVSADADGAQSLLRAQSRELEETKKAIGVLNENYYRLQEENYELNASLAETAEDLDEAEAELESEDAQTFDLRKQVSTSEQAVGIINDNYYALQEEHYELMETLYETQQAVEDLRVEKDKAEKRLSLLESAIPAGLEDETASAVAESKEDETEPVVAVSPPEVFEEKAYSVKEEADLELMNVGGLVGKMKSKFAELETRIQELEEEKAELVRKQSLADETNPFEGTQSIVLENEDLKTRLEDLRKEYDRLSEQSINDSMSIRGLQQDYETLNGSHQRLRQEKAGLENILTETRSRLEQYDQQVRMLMDANAELEETRHNLRQAQDEIKTLKSEAEDKPTDKEEIRSLQQQLETMRLELEEQETQRQSFVEQAARKDHELRQAQARLIELQSAEIQEEIDQDYEGKSEDESPLPKQAPANASTNSIEMDEANGPEISDRFSLTQRASEIDNGNGALIAEEVDESAATAGSGAADEYDLGDDDGNSLDESVEPVDPHAIASDGKEVDPSDVSSTRPTGFRVHVADGDEKDADPSIVPIEIRSESAQSSTGQRMSVTLETERRISYVDETEPVIQPRMPEIVEEDHPDAIPADDPGDIDI